MQRSRRHDLAATVERELIDAHEELGWQVRARNTIHPDLVGLGGIVEQRVEEDVLVAPGEPLPAGIDVVVLRGLGSRR